MRLTEKCKNNYAVKREMLRVGKDALLVASELTDKLGKYEDIEEELGIDLAIFVKAILIGFYYKDVSSHNIPYIGFARGKRIDKNYFRVNNHPFYFKDYGKTWALNKEELE